VPAINCVGTGRDGQDPAGQIEGGLEFLATALQDVPTRHRSMEAFFDHSWRLLAPREQGVLRQLSTFRGGFTREAAEAVTGARPADLARLVGASWLRLEANGRYGMHELIGQYCLERLKREGGSAAGESSEEVRQRHATYYASYLSRQDAAFLSHRGRLKPSLWKAPTSRRPGMRS
jgi:predicted ATPase